MTGREDKSWFNLSDLRFIAKKKEYWVSVGVAVLVAALLVLAL